MKFYSELITNGVKSSDDEYCVDYEITNKYGDSIGGDPYNQSYHFY